MPHKCSRKSEKDPMPEIGKGPEIQNSNSVPISGNSPVISYNVNEDERPDGLRIRWKIRVESGKKAAARDAQLASAVKELLQWSREHRRQS
jgi:hypothetical protein